MDIEAFATQFASLEMAEMMLMTPDHGHFSRSYVLLSRYSENFLCELCVSSSSEWFLGTPTLHSPRVDGHHRPANARVRVVPTGSRVTTCAGKAENEQWVSRVDIVSMTIELEDPGGNEIPRMCLGGMRTRGGEVESHGSRADTSSGRAESREVRRMLRRC